MIASSDREGETTSRRNIGLLGITALAVGSANVAFLVLANLISAQGTIAIPLLIFGLLISYLACPGYVELVLMYPKKVGGIAAVCTDAFRPYNPILANLAGTNYWISWGVASGVIAFSLADIVHELFMPWISSYWIATIYMLLIMLLNFCGLRWTQRIAIPAAVIAATLALLSCLIPVFSGQVSWSQATTYHLNSEFLGLFGTLSSIMAGIYLVGWVAPVFENCLCFVGDSINPKTTIPRSMLCAGVLGFLYTAICPFIWLGLLGPTTLMGAFNETILMPAYKPLFANLAHTASIWFIFFNITLILITSLVGAPRTLSQLAKDGLVPEFLGLNTRHNVPWVATIASALLSIAIIWIGAPIWLFASSNFGYLLSISLPIVAVWLLRRDAANAPRLYRAPDVVIELGLFTAFIWLISTVLGFRQYGLQTMVIGITASFSGALLYFWRILVDRKKAGVSLFRSSLHIKLTGTVLIVLVIDAIGYLIAVSNITQTNHTLVAALEDIFVIVAMLTLGVGLILPGIIIYGANKINDAAKRLIKYNLTDFTLAMKALAEGNLETAHPRTKIEPISMKSNDEIAEMADSFNMMQEEIQRSAGAIDYAREGLREARKKLTISNISLNELNATLEERVKERTHELEVTNTRLKQEIVERTNAEAKAKSLHNQLIIAARRAGMADIATTILHNIGNVLNSVNISSGMISDRVKTLEIKKLEQLVALMEQHKKDIGSFMEKDEQGKKIIEFLPLIAESLTNDKKYILDEIFNLEKSIEHMRNIVVMQQTLKGAFGVTEEVSVTELLEDALVINQAVYQSSNIKVIRKYGAIKNVSIDRVKLLQIIVNLIKNSIDSLSECQAQERILTLRVVEENDTNFKIEIADNGLGIDPKKLTDIFSYGFTTKKGGHGIGLHTSAVAAQEMGGQLTAESKGQGGATFILILPYQSAE